MKEIVRGKASISILIIFIFHLIGIIGFTNEVFVEIFKVLVPLHLMLMLAIVLWNNPSWNKHFILFSLFVYLFSFLIEMIGTNTGLLFGEYTYGETLGYKLWNTPLLIGVNWFLLVYGVGSLLSFLKLKSNVFFAVLGASILVCLDYLIEPVAIRFDYWSWGGLAIPIQNYITWWVLAFLFVLIFRKLHFYKPNIVPSILLIVQFLFFMLLNLL